MDGVGVVDEAGRLRLLGAAVAGAAFGGVLAVLLASSWTAATTGLLVGVGVPAGAVGAGIGVWSQLRSWRTAGGYEQSVRAQRWVADGAVPPGVPAETWVPLLQAQADREGAGWSKIVLCVLWSLMTWSAEPQHGPVLTVLLVGLWVGIGAWSALWVIPGLALRARSSVAGSPPSPDRVGLEARPTAATPVGRTSLGGGRTDRGDPTVA